MGYLPRLSAFGGKTQVLSAFPGLDTAERTREGCMRDMKNLTSSHYPVLSVRKRRHRVRRLTKPNGLFMHSKLCWVDGGQLYYNGAAAGEVEDSEKSFAAMGAELIIFPDKLSYNTATGELKPLENSVSVAAASWTMCDAEGTDMSCTVSQTAPVSPENGAYWIDTSQTPHTLMLYSSQQGTWTAVETAYVKISGEGISEGFSRMDAVTVTCAGESVLSGDFCLEQTGEDYVVVAALIDAAGSGGISLARTVPDMDFITENGNRLWGCSNSAHEIYASKLGDAKNFHSYSGLASDSYAMTVGTSGDFTGAATHQGSAVFFKQDVIQKVYGAKPSNFQLSNTSAKGVAPGSGRSLAMLDESVYYLAEGGVRRLFTGLPYVVSDALCGVSMKNAVGGGLEGKYYLSCQTAEGWSLFVHDEQRGMWVKEDDTQVKYFAGSGGELWFVAADGWLWNINGDSSFDSADACSEDELEWFAETGSLGMSSPDMKRVSRMRISAEAEAGSVIRAELSCDNAPFEEVCRIAPERKRAFVIPITPRRCAELKIRLSGKGGCRIFSIARDVEG